MILHKCDKCGVVGVFTMDTDILAANKYFKITIGDNINICPYCAKDMCLQARSFLVALEDELTK